MIAREKNWFNHVEILWKCRVYIYRISPLGKRIVYLRLEFFHVFFLNGDFEKSDFMYHLEIYRLFCMPYLYTILFAI